MTTTALLSALRMVIRHEAQRLTQDGHTFDTAVAILAARGAI